jgi:hypothetical protein
MHGEQSAVIRAFRVIRVQKNAHAIQWIARAPVLQSLSSSSYVLNPNPMRDRVSSWPPPARFPHCVPLDRRAPRSNL